MIIGQLPRVVMGEGRLKAAKHGFVCKCGALGERGGVAVDCPRVPRWKRALDLKIMAWTIPAIVLPTWETKKQIRSGGATGSGAGRPASSRSLGRVG
jgi:hypothetical protein